MNIYMLYELMPDNIVECSTPIYIYKHFNLKLICKNTWFTYFLRVT